MVLFAILAFFQGLNEPTEGLPSQPIRSILRSWGEPTSRIAGFSAALAIPWLVKPLFGFLSDFVPIAGTRRRSYLILTSGASALGMLGLFLIPVSPGATASLLAWLLVPTASVACADVATDALMVERGGPWNVTGRFQAAQWASMYVAGIAAGLVGAELCERHIERWAFLICGLVAVASLGVAVIAVREPPRIEPNGTARARLRLIVRMARAPSVLGIGGFLFLWNFNPFSNAVLHLHMTGAAGFSERFFGILNSLWSVAAIMATLAYGWYDRRVSTRVLTHSSIALGVASTLAYTLVRDQLTAIVVSLFAGFSYMTATLIQLNLAARSCPPEVAGTVFALFMAAENLAASLSVWVGGLIYERGSTTWGPKGSFQVLLLLAATTTAGCWFLMPILPRERVALADRGRTR